MSATAQDHIGFKLCLSDINRGIFLPKYYNPEITGRLQALRKTHNLALLGELIEKNYVSVSAGDEIGKMAYGTGSIPFIRTSDISNWEIKTDAKQGVSEEIYEDYAKKQDVKVGDILFVRDGTYLIGQIALVTSNDLPFLYQSHILKLRVLPKSPISASLLMASLSSPIVKRQIRCKQFTADIIDTIGDRYKELALPIPKEIKVAEKITKEVDDLISERARLCDKIRTIPYWVEGLINSPDDNISAELIPETSEKGNIGFMRKFSSITNGIFIPKYYDPLLKEKLKILSKTHTLVSIAELVKNKIISWGTGIEIGKMAYGTGSIPFIRTSDISNWELKGDPKQAVSAEIYESNKQDVQAGDIFVVRDGTYLVGTSCILTDRDTKILYCGGLYKFRVENTDEIDPYLLLALLNSPIVRRQMRAKQFTRDIIDTLGKRIFEVILPIPKDADLRKQIASKTRQVITTRVQLRDRTKEIAIEVEGVDSLPLEETEIIETA